ncbi:hypothetical protein ACNKHS_14230 [Shigella flexneri]
MRLVDDDGNVYLAGVKPGEHMSVFWSGVAHCIMNLRERCLPICLTAGHCHASIKATSRRVPDDIKPVIQEQTQR